MTAIEARQRVYGVDTALAHDPRASTVVGRLEMAGVITSDHYSVALSYIELRNNYQRAIDARADFNQPKPEGCGNGNYDEWAVSTVKRWKALQECLREYMIESASPMGATALDMIVVRNEQADYLNVALRRVLNWMHEHFFCVKRKGRII